MRCSWESDPGVVFSDFFVMILLPMTLADKNRLYAYELTMLGTIIALVNFTMFITTSLLASFVIEVLTLSASAIALTPVMSPSYARRLFEILQANNGVSPD